MALSGIQRTFADILDSIWGKDAQTSIPTQPVSGIAYRDTDAEFESGQKYDSLGESSRWNQMLYLLTGLMSELTAFGILPWSAAQPYSKGALCIGSDGTLWQAQIDIAASPTNPVPPGTDDNVWSRPKIFGFVPDSIRVIAGTGMTGGGPLSGDVTLSAKLDGKTVQADAGDAITVKDVAIGGNLEDLASARGQIGNSNTQGSHDFSSGMLSEKPGMYTAINSGSTNVPFTGPFAEMILGSPTHRGSLLITSGRSSLPRAAISTIYTEQGFSGYTRLITEQQIGDGLRVNNGIISVPEYEGATASTAGTSGLVPPATAGQQESFLTGGGEYKPAVQQGGGKGQGNNKIYIGYSESGLKAQADTLDLGNVVTTSAGCTKAPSAALADDAEIARTLVVTDDGQTAKFNWVARTGQPEAVWGGNAAEFGNMYTWNPINFSVNYATSASNAWQTTVVPNVVVGDNSNLPAGGTWTFYSYANSQVTYGVVAGGTYISGRHIAIRKA